MAVDLFYIDFEDAKLAVLNIVDHGAGFQTCDLVDPRGRQQTASKVWASFERTWIRFFGPPEVLISDRGARVWRGL